MHHIKLLNTEGCNIDIFSTPPQDMWWDTEQFHNTSPRAPLQHRWWEGPLQDRLIVIHLSTSATQPRVCHVLYLTGTWIIRSIRIDNLAVYYYLHVQENTVFHQRWMKVLWIFQWNINLNNLNTSVLFWKRALWVRNYEQLLGFLSETHP